MKNTFVTLFLLMGSLSMSAQLTEGSWLLELNTGSSTTGNTSFSYSSRDGEKSWSVGADVGYFIEENLAIKLGIGYGHIDNEDNVDTDNPFAYKAGIKYYLGGLIPLGVDFTGISQGDINENYFGFQGGYAWFISSRVSLEPTVRYNVSLDKDVAKDELQVLIGFAFHI